MSATSVKSVYFAQSKIRANVLYLSFPRPNDRAVFFVNSLVMWDFKTLFNYIQLTSITLFILNTKYFIFHYKLKFLNNNVKQFHLRTKYKYI